MKRRSVSRVYRPMNAWWRLMAVPFFTGGMLGSVAAIWEAPVQAAAKMRLAYVNSEPRQGTTEIGAIKATFRRPAAVPFPADNAFSEPKRALGEALFHDKRLSLDGSLACASCHERGEGFADGKSRDGACRAVHSSATHRHSGIWPGRRPCSGMAAPAALRNRPPDPIKSPDEMAQPLAAVVERLNHDPEMAQAFAGAFPGTSGVNGKNLAKAIATYERTFVSPPTRFDRWIDG